MSVYKGKSVVVNRATDDIYAKVSDLSGYQASLTTSPPNIAKSSAVCVFRLIQSAWMLPEWDSSFSS